MPNTSGSVDLSTLSKEEQDAVERLAAERGGPTPEEPEKQKFLTAFLVLVELNGNPIVRGVPEGNVELLVQPTPDLVHGAAAVIIKDGTAVESAQSTAEVMQLQAQQMMQQMQAQQQEAAIRSQLAAEGGRVAGVRG